MMTALLGIALIFIALLLIVLGLSVGIAFLLDWLIPALGLEMALLVAVIAVGQTMLIYGRLVGSVPPVGEPEAGIDPRSIMILDQEVVLPQRRRKRR